MDKANTRDGGEDRGARKRAYTLYNSDSMMNEHLQQADVAATGDVSISWRFRATSALVPKAAVAAQGSHHEQGCMWRRKPTCKEFHAWTRSLWHGGEQTFSDSCSAASVSMDSRRHDHFGRSHF